jgi:hypothetical protein
MSRLLNFPAHGQKIANAAESVRSRQDLLERFDVEETNTWP